MVYARSAPAYRAVRVFCPECVTEVMLDQLATASWDESLRFLAEAKSVLLDPDPSPRIAEARASADEAYLAAGRHLPLQRRVADAVYRATVARISGPYPQPVHRETVADVQAAALPAIQIGRVADLLSADELDLLSGPWRAAFGDPFATLRFVQRRDREWRWTKRGQAILLDRIQRLA